MGYFFIPVCTKLIWWVCCQKALFFQFHLTIEASAIWSSSRVWQLNLLEFVFGWVRTIFLETLPNNMWWYRGCLIFFFLGFWPQDSTNLCNSPAVILGESFGYSNSPPQRALGRYRHTSSFRQIFNIFSWLEPLNYYPDGGNGDFQCFKLFFLQPLSICEAQQSCSSHQKYIFCFFSLWWMIKGIWPLCSSYL